MYQERIQQNQKFLLRLLNLHIGHYYPLRKWLGIDYCGVIDEVSHLSYSYDSKLIRKGGHLYKQQTRVYQQPDLGYKLNLILDCIPEAIIPKYGQPSWGLIGMRLARCSESVFQPDLFDGYIYKDSKTPPGYYGNFTSNIQIGSSGGTSLESYRGLIKWNISDLIDPIWKEATISLYATANYNSATVYLYRLTRTDWTGEATYQRYKSGSNWTNLGGDFTTTNGASFGLDYTTSGKWYNVNCLNLIEDCYENQSEQVHLIIISSYESTYSTTSSSSFDSCRSPSNQPKLTVICYDVITNVQQLSLSTNLESYIYPQIIGSDSFSLSANLEYGRWRKDTTHSQIWIKEETHNELYKS